MQATKKVTEVSTRQFNLPPIDMTDIMTIFVLIIIGMLLMTDRNVPQYMVALVTLGAGIKVHTAQQVKDFRGI